MYRDFFGFKEKPFTVTPNPRFVFLSKNHKEAFAHLLYGIENHSGFIVLTGEIGTGKTTVLRTLLGQLDRSTIRSALILNPCLSAPELLRNINREFGIAWQGLSVQELLDALNIFLLDENRAGHTVALVIDEAQNLDPQVLEQIRLISNLETETDKLIQIVLAGQPELAAILAKTELRQFNQRVAVRYHLAAMDFEDTVAYIEHRLEIAGGWRSANFTRGALKKIFRYARGVPRLINIVCDRALLIGYIDEKKIITREMAGRAVNELEPDRKSFPILRVSVTISLAAVAVATILFTGQFHVSPTKIPVPQRPPHPAVSPPSAPLLTEEEFRSYLMGLEERSSLLQAFNALAKIWNLTPLAETGKSLSSRTIERLGEENGLHLNRQKISFSRLLEINSPALLEIRLDSGARRYLALLSISGDVIEISPPLSGHSYLHRGQLEEAWSGRVFLPWLNLSNIPRLGPGMRSDAVSRFQRLLRKAGAYRGEISGVYDRQTTAAVISFQKAHGLAGSGRPGKETLFFLYREGNATPIPRLAMNGGAPG
jgi:general secretion pathway protein A